MLPKFNYSVHSTATITGYHAHINTREAAIEGLIVDVKLMAAEQAALKALERHDTPMADCNLSNIDKCDRATNEPSGY